MPQGKPGIQEASPPFPPWLSVPCNPLIPFGSSGVWRRSCQRRYPRYPLFLGLATLRFHSKATDKFYTVPTTGCEVFYLTFPALARERNHQYASFPLASLENKHSVVDKHTIGMLVSLSRSIVVQFRPGGLAQWESSCLTSRLSWVQIPHPPDHRIPF